MRNGFISGSAPRVLSRRAVPVLVGALLCVVVLAPAAAVGTSTMGPETKPGGVSATLEQCVTSTEQAERAATFAGEMASLSGSSKMEMRIDVLERMPREMAFHMVSAPGLGVWRTAAPGVKSYRYLKEVTNLAAPAFYRAVVRFRWFNSKGRLIKAAELRTPRCAQPVTPPEEETTTGT
jgi:hypothetical protein